MYDIAFLGHYTQDTIVSTAGRRQVDGGAFNYGAHVAARMGLRTAAITRLARADWRVVERLEARGVDVFATPTPHSTCLRLEYPSPDVDERTLYRTHSAGPFTVPEVTQVQARSVVIGASVRGEVPLEVLEALAASGAQIAVDVQGFVRVVRDGVLVYEPWPERDAALARVDILKTDAVEARQLTGLAGKRRAAQALADRGPSQVVLTHRDGVLVLAGGRFYEAGFYPSRLVGRSGRGDTCLAAYTARRFSRGPRASTVWAAAVASLKMEAEGPFDRGLEEVEALIQRRYAAG